MRKVLVVDDELTSREMLAESLKSWGYGAATAENGAVAVSMVKKSPHAYDLIICDMNMPEMDGLAVVKAIRQNFETKDTPVIMCTSVAEKEKILAAVRLRINDYIVKPFDPDSLKQKITNALK